MATISSSAVPDSMDPYQGRITQESVTEFKADDLIIKTVSGARTVYTTLRTNHLKRITLAKEIDGLIQGNPPYNPAELAQAGLQHIANFNDMSARAVFERACLAYWNLLNNSQYLTTFVIHAQSPETTYWAQKLAEHWDFAVRNYWPSFIVNVASLTSQIVKLGVSPAIFPDERDPRWRVVEYSRFYIPDQTQSDLDMLTTVCIETDMTVQYLWSVYTEFKDKKATPDATANDADGTGQRGPWNIAEIGFLLVQLANQATKASSSPMDIYELERKYYSGDINYMNMYSDTVRIISFLQKGYNGKISHYMFHREIDNGQFMFFQKDQYEDMNEAITIFTMNPGEYTIHANKGLGHKIFSLAQAKIMLDCSVVDMAKWASTPIIKSPALSTKDADQIRFYPGVPTNIGSAELVTNNMGANVQNVVAAAQYLGSQIQYNITYSGGDSGQPDPDQGSLSPTQSRLMAFREFSVLKNNVMHFYSIFDRLLLSMTAKMLRSTPSDPGYEISRVWKERCIADGVPEAIFNAKGGSRWRLPEHLEVSATRAVGAGSQVAHLMGLQELQAIVGSFGPREEREFKRQFIMATLGPEYVQTFMQERDDVDEKAGGASLAAVENAIMQQGMSPVFSADNEQRAHFATHMALAQQMTQMLKEQQMDPIAVDKVLTVLVPHLGEHLQALSRSMFTQQFFIQAKPAYDQLVKFAQLNRHNAEQMAQAQQKKQQQEQEQQQEAMSKEQLATYTMQQDEQRKNTKLTAQLERQRQQHETKEAMLVSKTENEIATIRHKAIAETEIKQQTTSAKIAAEQTKAAASHDSDEMDEETTPIADLPINPFIND